MQQSTRRPARRSAATKSSNNDKKNLMSRQYTSSFSGIDWGGMLGNSFRSKRGSDFAVGLESIATMGGGDDEFCMSGQSLSNGSSGASLSGSKKTAAADSSNNDGGDGSNTNNNNDDMESTGSKLLVEQILQEAQKSSVESGGFPITFWKGRKMKNNKGVYVPKKKKGGRSSSSSQQGEQQEGQQLEKQRGKNRVRFSFNFDADDDDAEAERAAPTKRSDKRDTAAINAVLSPSSSSVCQVVLMLVVAIILGIVLFAFAPLNISSIFIQGQGKEDGTVLFDSDYSSSLTTEQRGQEMLELEEQINIACGESILLQNSVSIKGSGGMMSACQSLCHNNMCCFEEDEEYSCKDDVTKDCGVYAGCVVLIDDNFW